VVNEGLSGNQPAHLELRSLRAKLHEGSEHRVTALLGWPLVTDDDDRPRAALVPTHLVARRALKSSVDTFARSAAIVGLELREDLRHSVDVFVGHKTAFDAIAIEHETVAHVSEEPADDLADITDRFRDARGVTLHSRFVMRPFLT